MLRDIRKVSPEAQAVWVRRADALAAGALLMDEKPDRGEWTDRDVRIWLYAMAISRRLQKLH